jgi:indolepyruvate decarboxylase
MRVGDYLFEQFKLRGVGDIFGIPGDFALPLYQSLAESGLRVVVNTHEPAAGFAADAYARIRGLGGVVVTFGAGGLNMVNPIAEAYAEKSPVIVVSGAPEIRGRKIDTLLHHKVRTFETQLNVYREITGSAVALSDSATAGEAIDHVFETTMRTKRPGYIEVPRDIAFAEMGQSPRRAPRSRRDPAALREVMREVVARLNGSSHPVVYAGVEIQRFGLRKKLIALVERLGLPVVTSIEGKAVFPEDDPHFVGIYMGHIGSEAAMRTVENSDCVLMLGAFLTDVSTGIYTAKVDRSRVVSASAEAVVVGYHTYTDVVLTDLVEHLLRSRAARPRSFAGQPPRPQASWRVGALTSTAIIEELNTLLDPSRSMVVSDVGDCLYAAIDLKAENFLGPGYYNSMGFGVPAAVAAQLAVPEKKVVALVGDGAFQMTGMELSTAKALGISPIIIVLKNSRYATLEAIAGKKPYFDLEPWDHVAIARALGGDGARVHTRSGFREAFAHAQSSQTFFLIEATVAPRMSSVWARLAQEVRTMSERAAPSRR